MEPQTVVHPWHGVSFGEHAPRVVNAIIEIPQGSRCKYEIDKPTGLLKLDRNMHYHHTTQYCTFKNLYTFIYTKNPVYLQNAKSSK